MSLPAATPRRVLRRVPRLLAGACAVAAVTLWPDAATTTHRLAAEDRVVRTITVADEQTLALATTIGAVQITGEPGRRDVVVEIIRRAPNAGDFGRLPITLTDTPAGPRLDVTQPAGGTDIALRADLTVTAPADVRLDTIAIGEGRLELRHLSGAVRAVVARGDIVADDVSGLIRLETTLGSIAVTRARLLTDGLLRLRTFNGDVRVGLSDPLADTRVMALALNGTITSAVPLEMKDGWGPRWGEATIGRPDRVLSIDVVTGAIRIEAPARR